MKITPRSVQEIESMGLMAPGFYSFVVKDAENCVSKTGNDMIKLTLSVQDANGFKHTLFDYLLQKGKQMEFKLRHFCEHTGLMDKYNAGELLAADCVDKAGVCEIVLQPGADKYDGTKYPDKNAVKDYMENKVSMSKAPTPEVTGHPAFEDDIPF